MTTCCPILESLGFKTGSAQVAGKMRHMATKKKATKKAAKKSAKKSTAPKKGAAKKSVAKKPVAKKKAVRRVSKAAATELTAALQAMIDVLKGGGASVQGFQEQLPCSRPTVYARLKKLAALGYKVKVGKKRTEGKTRGPEASFYTL